MHSDEFVPDFDSLRLFDIAEAAAGREARAWNEDPGLNLFLEDTIAMLRAEIEGMAAQCFSRARRETGVGERARIFACVGQVSDAVRDWRRYEALQPYADIYLLGVLDASFPPLPNVCVIPIAPTSVLAKERVSVVEARSFGAVMFALDAGQLEDARDNPEASRFFEGYFSARADVVSTVVNRLASALELPPAISADERDFNLSLEWTARLNTRLLESLEAQKLAARAQALEASHLSAERGRLEAMVRSYVGGRTWDEVQQAIEQGRDDLQDEWRQEFTICFCDIADFTPTSERLHPVEVAAFLNDHFARLYDIVRAHGGDINKFIGDAMLAIFEEPVEAFIAAQKMIRAASQVELPREFSGQGLRVRVGLNTGQVAVVNLGVPEHRERTVLGDAVNLSQRLQSLAQPRQIVMAESTFARLPLSLAKHLEKFETHVKGKRQPVQAYRWSTYSERMAPNEAVVLRERLLSASRRTSLSERLNGKGE